MCKTYIEGLLSLPRCPLCGLPFMGKTFEHLCPECSKSPPPFKLFFSIPYTEQTKGPILNLKYSGEREVLHLLEEFPPAIPEHHIIVPVPLHKKRLKERGFNQAALIALGVSRITGARVVFGACERVKKTRPLSELSESERREEIKGAFRLKKNVFKGKKILIVDDIYTTGSTIRELAKLIKEGGAEEVLAYALFRRFPT